MSFTKIKHISGFTAYSLLRTPFTHKHFVATSGFSDTSKPEARTLTTLHESIK